jgi:tRNA uracil 4-sulfurtransferase
VVLPRHRPLVGWHKQATIDVAEKIGTYELSIQPEPDCCTLFMPKAPVVHGVLAECEAAEALLDMEGLVKRALEGTTKQILEPDI